MPFVARDLPVETRDVPFVRCDLAAETRDVPFVRCDLAAETRDVSFVRCDLAAETRDVPFVRRDLAAETRDVPFVRRDLAAETGDVPFVGSYLPAQAPLLGTHVPCLAGAGQHGQHQVAPVASFVVEGLGVAIDAPFVLHAGWAGSDRHPVKPLGPGSQNQPTAGIHARDRRTVCGHHNNSARPHAERHPVYGHLYRRRLTFPLNAGEPTRLALGLL